MKATKKCKWLIIRQIVLALGLTFSLLTTVKGQNTQVETAEDAQLFKTGVELLNREKYAGARKSFEQYLTTVIPTQKREDLRAIDAEYYIAYCALNLFNPDAEKLFQDFIIKYPWHASASAASYELGYFFYNKKDYKKAIEYLEKANPAKLTKDQQTDLSFILGYSYFNQKEFEKSLEQFNKVKKEDHKYTYAASYYAGYLELKTGKYLEALEDLRTAEKNEAYSAVIPYLEANVYYHMGAYDTLIQYSEKALKRKDIQEKDELYLLIAEAYFKKENYAKAAEFFLNSVGKGALNNPLRYRLAFSQYMSGKYEQAIENFKPLASSQDAMGQASSYYMGLSYLKIGNKQYALAALQSASKAEFSKTVQEEALFNYAKVNAELDNINETILSLKTYNRLFPKSKNNEEADALLSEALLKTNNYTEAINYIESLKGNRSLRTNTAYQRVTFYKGTEEFNNKNFPKALQMFNKSTEFYYDKEVFVAANFWKGEVYSIMKEYDNAINSYSKIFQNAAKENDFYLKARYGIGYAYYHTGQYGKALEHFQAYVNALEESKKFFYDDAVLRLGDIYAYQKKYNEALKYYDEAIASRNPDLDYAYFKRGVVLEFLNKDQEALESYKKVTGAFDNSVYADQALFKEASLLHSTGKFDQAIPLFTKIIAENKVNTTVPYSLNFRAIGYGNEGQNDKAIDDYKRIIDEYPQHPIAGEALTGLHEALESENRLDEFPEYREKLEKVNPGSSSFVRVDYDAAKSLHSNQKYDKAAEAYNQYIQKYPESPYLADAKFFLADSYAKSGQKDKAIEQYKEVIAGKPFNNYDRAVFNLADLYFKMGDYSNAKTYYLFILNRTSKPKDRNFAWISLMETYYELKNLDSVNVYAKLILEHGKSTIDENRATLYLGKVAYKKKDYDTAIDYFISTINLAKDENAAEAKYMIGKIQYDRKQYKQSLETLFEFNKVYFMHEKWYASSFLLIAENYIALDEIFQAKATLQSIIDKATHQESKEIARKRLAEIESNKGKGEQE